MKVLVVGSGGREHAICWKISQSPKVDKIYCAPGNAGIAEVAECVYIKAMEFDKLVAFAKENAIDLTVIGMDDPLVGGIVDAFEAEGLRVFGPRKNAAILEGSKAFSKDLMKKYNIPTAAYEVFEDADEAIKYLETSKYPIVLKADGLALGKGVLICNTLEEAKAGVKEIMEEFDYPGIRMMIEANLERIRQPFKIDISTDDAITPGAVEYKYKLMFEDRSISVLSYNLETLLAEKMQTILARGLANTRMRDFYDVYEIMNSKADQISFDVLKKAFAATCMKRETSFGEEEVRETLDKIKDDSGLEEMWNRFKRVNYFVDDLSWGEVSETIVDKIEKIAVS